MNDLEKIKLLNEVILQTKPERVDYSGGKYYSIELITYLPITISLESYRIFTLKGHFEGEDTIVMTLMANQRELFTLRDVAYVASQGDRTPIYKIIRASILLATELTGGSAPIAIAPAPPAH